MSLPTDGVKNHHVLLFEIKIVGITGAEKSAIENGGSRVSNYLQKWIKGNYFSIP